MKGALILIVLLVLLMIAVSVLVILVLLDGNRSRGGDSVPRSFDAQRGISPDGRMPGGFAENGETIGVSGGSTRSLAAVFLEECSEGKRYRVELMPGSVIGRTVPGYPTINDVSVSHSIQVSRRHCVMYLEGSRVMVRNISKTSFTAVNNRILEAPCEVRLGDLIQLGDTRLRVIQIQY